MMNSGGTERTAMHWLWPTCYNGITTIYLMIIVFTHDLNKMFFKNDIAKPGIILTTIITTLFTIVA